jgi:hypothetical protein
MPAKKTSKQSTTTKKSAAGSKAAAAAKKPASPPAGGGITAWADDPLSADAIKPVSRPVPNLGKGPYALRMATKGKQPAPAAYPVGTPQFRYWAAADAVRRGADYWQSIFSLVGKAGVSWEPGAVLPVKLDEGVDLNAYYDRAALNFFHDSAGGSTVYSGESPDVVCHELGHAVLDSFRPELWNSSSDEVAAFHESFGDMSAILSALQVPSMRQAVLNETGGTLYRSSRLSRLAEQLGWAIRQGHPDLVEADCLRNAVNSFFYRAPDTLPPNAPAAALSSEAHSFSRVFTGGFFAALSGMLAIESAKPKETDLQQLSVNMGRLLVEAILAASVVPDYFSQVAVQMISQDQAQFKSKYRDALKSAFVKRGVLSLQAAATVSKLPAIAGSAGIVAADSGAVPGEILISGEEYGLPNVHIRAFIPGGRQRFAAAAALDMGTAQPVSGEKAGRSFVEDLFRRGRVDLAGHGGPATRIAHPLTSKTHYLEKKGTSAVLLRRTFDCGFGPCH